MMKEDIVPTAADRVVYNLAPLVFLVPCVLIFATIPVRPRAGVVDLNIGVLFFLAVSSLEIIGLFMGGWGSNNKYALLSAMRAVNQIISYDLPFVFAALVPVVLAGSMQLSAIVAAQQGLWFVGLPGHRPARLRRLPGGHHRRGEPGALRHPGGRVGAGGGVPRGVQRDEVRHHPARRVRAHDRLVVPGCAPVPGRLARAGARVARTVWFLLKAMAVFLLVTWVRWSFVRIRVDQILGICWKLLLPATLIILLLGRRRGPWQAL